MSTGNDLEQLDKVARNGSGVILHLPMFVRNRSGFLWNFKEIVEVYITER